MTTRDELIEAGRDAMGRNDGWRWWHPRHLARLLDVWESLIRADERAKAHVHATGTSTGDGPCCECCYDVPAITDLRVKVEGMPFGVMPVPHAPDCPGRPGYRGICNCARPSEAWLWRSDVLALLDEAQR